MNVASSPGHIELDVQDGKRVAVRSVEPSDQKHIENFFRILDDPALNFRFFGITGAPTVEELRRFVEVDPAFEQVLVAQLEGNTKSPICGLAHYRLRELGGDAEEKVARFALAVLPEYHKQGIGTTLLQQLAQHARKAGLTEFQADVLGPTQGIFQAASRSGLRVSRSSRSGIIHMSLALSELVAPQKDKLTAEIEAIGRSIVPLLRPSSVAVVGASRRDNSIGSTLVANLIDFEFAGEIYPINPKATEIQGLRCFPSLRSVQQDIDLAVIAVPAAHVEAVLEECAACKVKAVVIISSGFAESTEEGRIVEERLTEIVRRAGMRMVGPNCMGVFNTDFKVRLNAIFAPGSPPLGNVGMLSQSGALGIAILNYARKLDLGLSSFVSVGNKADISANDLLCFWESDSKTDVIALYLESLGNPRRFAKIAPQIARRKPIVAVKSGRTRAGSRAARSHSAALASRDVAVDALLEEAGVIRTATLEELFDVVALLSTQKPPLGKGVGVITNAGGPGILLADAVENEGLVLPEFQDDTVAALRKFLPSQAGLLNPVDMIASADAEEYRQAIAIVGRDPKIHSLVVIYVNPWSSDSEEIAEAIAQGAGDVPDEKPVLTVFLSTRGAPKLLSRGPRGKLPSYSFPENAAQALAAAQRYAAWRQQPEGEPFVLDEFRQSAIRAIVDRALPEIGDEGWLGQEDLTLILQAAGIEVAGSEVVLPEDAADAAERTGYPLVLKAVSPDVLHKSDIGGVILGLQSRKEVEEAAQKLVERVENAGAHLQGLMLQREVRGGIEAFIGVTVDKNFGPLVVCGLGGVQVELLKDVSFAMPPITDQDAARMIGKLRARKLLEGFRGQPAADKAALIDTLMKISALVEVVPEIRELDLNPVKVLEPGKGAVVVDGRLSLGYFRAEKKMT